MPIYTPDTCLCKIEYDKNIKWIQTLITCKLHEGKTKQTLLNAILSHNRSFNLKYGEKPSEIQEKLVIKDKEAEKKRIKKL